MTEEAWRLAAELRRIIARLIQVEVPDEELRRAADGAAAFADRLESILVERGRPYEGIGEAALAGSPHTFLDRSPVSGRSNPLAPPVRVRIEGDGGGRRAIGLVTFGPAHEGAPGCVHGGYTAAVFDEVLGVAQTFSGTVGMTGTLTVRYRSPAPLNHELRFDVGLDRVEGRKIFTSGACRVGERLVAEAEGIFISIDVTKLFPGREFPASSRPRGPQELAEPG